MSGTGKSTVVRALRVRGIRAIDMDEPGWSHTDGRGHQRWRVARLARAMDEVGDEPLVVSGCSEDQIGLRPRFSHVILLSAPPELIERRLASRSGNPFGKDPAELATVMADLRTIEPMLRASASCEIVTTEPVGVVVERFIEAGGLAR